MGRNGRNGLGIHQDFRNEPGIHQEWWGSVKFSPLLFWHCRCLSLSPPFCCSTCHPPHKQCWRQVSGVIILGLLWVLGPFLIVTGAQCHPLALPNLQAGACSSGHGWWSAFSDWGVLGAYRAGIPLLGSPSFPLHPPSLCQQPHILFEQGGGIGWLCVCDAHFLLFPVVYIVYMNISAYVP